MISTKDLGVLTFEEASVARPPARGIDVDTTLLHFCILTFYVDPQIARVLVHPRFELLTVPREEGDAALLSVVPFLDRDFRMARMPWPRWSFPQTNYRIYVRDRETGEHVVWFLGTSLDSASVTIPRYAWKLPWHRTRIELDAAFDEGAGRYERYRMQATRSWADAELELADEGAPPTALPGFEDLETALVVLTHPRLGYYQRVDGRLGSYSIWHERLRPTTGRVLAARFDLLDRLGLARTADTESVHSVLLQPSIDFRIYLPPRIV